MPIPSHPPAPSANNAFYLPCDPFAAPCVPSQYHLVCDLSPCVEGECRTKDREAHQLPRSIPTLSTDAPVRSSSYSLFDLCIFGSPFFVEYATQRAPCAAKPMHPKDHGQSHFDNKIEKQNQIVTRREEDVRRKEEDDQDFHSKTPPRSVMAIATVVITSLQYHRHKKQDQRRPRSGDSISIDRNTQLLSGFRYAVWKRDIHLR